MRRPLSLLFTPSPSHNVVIGVATLILTLATTAPARSAPQRLLLDDQLRAKPITLLALDGETIVYEDDRGRRREATFAGFAALLPMAPERISASAEPDPPSAQQNDGADLGLVELTDGQRYPGQAAPTGGTGEALVWSHPSFGRIVVPLTRLASVVLRPTEDGSALQPPREERFEDRLLLINGDRLIGFALSLGDPVEFETEQRVLRLPIQRVAEAQLANERQPLQGLAVWLDDGAVAVVESLRTRDQTVRLRLPDGQTASYPLDDVRAVAFQANQLRPLSDLKPIEQRAVGDRALLDGLTPTPTSTGLSAADLNAVDLLMPGPMSVRWEIPAGARRFSALAELPLDALPWGECELIIEVDGDERLRERLDSQRRRVRFNVPLDGEELEVRLEPGARGPINDRVILRQALILLGDSPEQPGPR